MKASLAQKAPDAARTLQDKGGKTRFQEVKEVKVIKEARRKV
jgi:hypothetical protein